MFRVSEILLEMKEKFKGKQNSIFAVEKAAVRKLILCINLSIPHKWLRPAEENIPTIGGKRHVSHREGSKKAWAGLVLLLSPWLIC